MSIGSHTWADFRLAAAPEERRPPASSAGPAHLAARPRSPGELPFGTVAEAVAAIRAGRMVIVTDDEDRENEGDLVMAAVHADAAAINFMTREGRGLVCVPLLPDRLADLDLPAMVAENDAPFATAFTVPVDVRAGTSTGISAMDRAATIAALVDPRSRGTDFVRPGHIFPLAARPGGVLERPGHTEAAVDLARLAGLPPAGVICEILAEDGSMSRGADLAAFAGRHGLPLLSIAALKAYLAAGVDRAAGGPPPPSSPSAPLLRRVAEAWLPTEHGRFRALAFADPWGQTHLALRLGMDDEGAGRSAEADPAEAPLVRLHSECLTGDVFHSRRCDCGAQLEEALSLIAAEGRGLLLYLRQEGRGIGLANKIRAYGLQDQGLDTVDANTALGLPADARDYSVAAAMLQDLGLSQVRLISNNPAKQAALQAAGVVVAARLPLRPALTPENRRYLETKRDRMGHDLDLAAVLSGSPAAAGASGSIRSEGDTGLTEGEGHGLRG